MAAYMPQPQDIYPHGFVSGSSRPASQGVTHPGISLVQARLTSEFSWDPKPIHSIWLAVSHISPVDFALTYHFVHSLVDGLSVSHISAQFLHKELPIKIARRAIELQTLPYGFSQKLAVLKVSCLPIVIV
ncbi:hypothetical protein LguiB_027654 [Lonicera macranthoides]